MKPTTTTAGAGPITYAQMLAAYNSVMQAPRLHAQVFGIDGLDDGDFETDVHLPGELCEYNPACRECYE